jgi:hypothetical protein
MHEIYYKSHQWKLSQERQYHHFLKSEIDKTRTAAKALTPAGQRLLVRLHTLFEQGNYAPVDRRQIAAALGRPGGLTVWDRRLLDRLCRMNFISVARRALPTYTDKHGVATGRGAKLVYEMDIDTGWRLARLLKKGSRR